MNLKQVSVEVAMLVQGLAGVEEELDNPIEDLPDDGLPQSLDAFSTEAEPLVARLQADVALMNAAFADVTIYFGEEKVESEEFFGLVDAFVRAFQGTERRLRMADEKSRRMGPVVAQLKKKQASTVVN